MWTQLIFESLLSFQRDGRLSNLELADRIGLTPAPCLRRVKRLESDGVVLGYTALINPAPMGRGFQVLVNIDLIRKDRAIFEAIEAAVAGLDESSRYVACFACPTTCFVQTDQVTRSRDGATTPPPAGLRRRRSVFHAAARSRVIYRPSQAHAQRRTDSLATCRKQA